MGAFIPVAAEPEEPLTNQLATCCGGTISNLLTGYCYCSARPSPDLDAPLLPLSAFGTKNHPPTTYTLPLPGS